MGFCLTFNADNSTVIHWILTKKMSFKRYWHGDYVVKSERIDYVLNVHNQNFKTPYKLLNQNFRICMEF